MKKMLALVAAAMLFTATQASATLIGVNGWGFDLSSIGGGTYTNIDRLSVDGVSTIVQSLPLVPGSTFTETGNLGIVKGYYEPGTFTDQFNLNTGNYNLYFYAQELTGIITATSATGFLYSFTPFAGNVSLVADTDLNFGNGVHSTLASFEIIPPSNGSNVGFLGGTGPNGTTDLTGLFMSALPGVFTWSGLDFSDLPPGYAAFGLINTSNTIQQITEGLNTTTLVVSSGGSFGVNVVPEPGTFALVGAGLIGLGLFGRRRMKK